MTATPPPGDPAWAPIRMRYEQDQETVEAIAKDVGLTRSGLSRLAKSWGWTLRGMRKGSTRPLQRNQSTADTIKRLKELLQQRLVKLEDELQSIGADVSALANERQIRSTNTLVRTIEKVIDLERKERLRKRKKTDDFRYFDDAQRQALADKIERLQRQWRGLETVSGAGNGGGGGTEQPVAVLGEAAATTSTDD